MQDLEVLFWDETQYQDSIEHMVDMQEEDFPENIVRIVVKGEELFTLTTVKKILQVFERNDYSVVIVSEYPYSYLYGMEYLPDGADAGQLGCDFIVSAEKRMKTFQEQIYISEDATGEEILELYQYILNYEFSV